jgi:hypothetical protein
MATEIGVKTETLQKLIEKTTKPGTDHLQHIWIIRCVREVGVGELCDHIYGANGSDFSRRRCPKCDGGAPGIPLP